MTAVTMHQLERRAIRCRYGTKRVAKAVLIAAVPPLMLKTPANPGGTPMSVFDGLRASVQADRSQFWMNLALPFYGYNRPGAKVSQGVIQEFWLQGQMTGFPGAYFCIKAFSETDQTEDLKKFDIPTLIIQGTDDQIVPYTDASLLQHQAHQGLNPEAHPWRPGRSVHDAQGPNQPGLARVFQSLSMTASQGLPQMHAT